MRSVQLVPATDYDMERLASIFNHAFEGYAVHIHQTASGLGTLITQTDVRLEHSRVLLSPGGTPAGIALLAVRGERGWIAGMAVAPTLRGRGYGDALLTDLLASARETGVRHLQLEALVENWPARRLYSRHGFRIVRQLAVFSGHLPRTRARKAARLDGEAALICAPLPLAEALEACAVCPRPAVPWQRDADTLAHMAPALTAIGLYEAGEPQAWLVTIASPSGQSVLDFCSRTTDGERRRVHALRLLRHIAPPGASVLMRAINIPEGDALAEALVARGCPVAARQVEMALDLSPPPAR